MSTIQNNALITAAKPQILVFPNKLDHDLFEINNGELGQTLHQWLLKNVPAYEVQEVALFSSTLNNQAFEQEQWQSYPLKHNDVLTLTVEAKEPITIIYAVIAVISVGMAIQAMNAIPDNYNNTTPDGSSIYDANTQGNRPRLMGIIPELAGRHKVFPDHLTMPRREYINNEQWIYLMLAVGVGEYEISSNEVFIGDTPLSNYAGDVFYNIFSPGALVTSHEAHRNVYTSAEVGGTAGTTGIELKGQITSIAGNSKWSFLDDTVQRLEYNERIGQYIGSSLPESWLVGDFVIFSGTPIRITDSAVTAIKMGSVHADTLTMESAPAGLVVGTQFYMIGTTYDSSILLEIVTVNSATSFLCKDAITGAINLWSVEITSNDATISIRDPGNDGQYRIVSIESSIMTLKKTDGFQVDDAAWMAFFTEAKITCVVNLGGSGEGAFAGAFSACPETETTDTLWLDFSLPQGLGELDDNGDFLSKSVSILIQYRNTGDIDWIDVTHTFTDNTNDQLGKTLKIDIGSKINPEVQVKRTTSADDNTRVYDKVEWTALKAELTSATSYADITTIAIKVRGTNALSNSAENKFNVIATRKLPVYENDAWTAPQATTDIAPFFAHVIKDVGHGDPQIGLTELARLHGVWQGRSDEFSAVFDNGSTLFNVLKRVLAAGFAEPTLDYGQIIPVRDEPRTGFDYMYQPENMTGPLKRETKLFDPDENDGIEVEYFSLLTWKPETVLCLLDGELGINTKKLRAFGITHKTKAWQFGMRKRREMRYRRTKYSFTTEMDALNSGYLSYDALADDIPGYSQTGKVIGANGRKITLSEPLEWGTGTHFISFRKPSGTLSGPYTCTAIANEDSVLLSTDLDFSPDCSGKVESALFQFGVANRWCLPSLVTDVKPSGTDKVSVTAVNYDARVYADDDNIPHV
jgi:hypothetical protein